MENRIIDRAKLKQISDNLKLSGLKVVTTNGCFDILHSGHVGILSSARALGDVLIVGINSDESVRKLKGPGRPINSEQDRAEVLSALRSVDFVTIFAEDTPVEFLTIVRPNIHVKGADYKPEQLAETPVVERFGGKVQILDLLPGKSTSSIVERMKDN